jgi:DNA-binding GntR family transcriptional regulator
MPIVYNQGRDEVKGKNPLSLTGRDGRERAVISPTVDREIQKGGAFGFLRRIRKAEMTKKNAQATSLVEVARKAVEELLLSGRLRPDQRLVEAELAEQIGISRTPVREALRQLEAKGLIHKRHAVGYVVACPSLEEIRNTFEVRLPLEKTAVRLACENATSAHIARASDILAKYDAELAEPKKGAVPLDRRINTETDWNGLFHLELYRAAGNPLLTQYILNLRDLDRLRRLTLTFTMEDFKRFQDQHHRILKAVKDRDKGRAEREVQRHLETLYAYYLKTATTYSLRV